MNEFFLSSLKSQECDKKLNEVNTSCACEIIAEIKCNKFVFKKFMTKAIGWGCKLYGCEGVQLGFDELRSRLG